MSWKLWVLKFSDDHSIQEEYKYTLCILLEIILNLAHSSNSIFYLLEMLDVIQLQSNFFCQPWCYQSFLIEEVIEDWVGSNCDIWTRFELIFVRVWWATKTTSSFSFAFITSSALNLVERNIWQKVISKSKWETIYILNLRVTMY